MNTLRRSSLAFAALTGAFWCVIFPSAALAQNAGRFAITITPPLFQLSLKPGDVWASSVKVVNTNPGDITVYAVVKDFVADDENGTPRFLPVMSSDKSGATLGAWLSVPSSGIHIPAQKSGEVPFTITVPKDASPGGHYAAILIGQKAYADRSAGTTVGTGSFVTSLFLVRIAGAVQEAGALREFSTDQTVYDSPNASFTLRFENLGNVHLQPQGNVIIYNMWGKERGRLDINEDSSFGNVLPSSTRQFVFNWQGDQNFFEVGKYTAIATLTFGQTAHQNVSRSVTFWVIPVGPTAGVIGAFLLIAFILVWGVRRYIRRALALEFARRGPTTGVQANTPPGLTDVFPDLRALEPQTLTGPLAETYRDLFENRPEAKSNIERSVLRKYALLFFVFLPFALIGIIWLANYFSAVLSNNSGGHTSVPGEIKNLENH